MCNGQTGQKSAKVLIKEGMLELLRQPAQERYKLPPSLQQSNQSETNERLNLYIRQALCDLQFPRSSRTPGNNIKQLFLNCKALNPGERKKECPLGTRVHCPFVTDFPNVDEDSVLELLRLRLPAYEDDLIQGPKSIIFEGALLPLQPELKTPREKLIYEYAKLLFSWENRELKSHYNVAPEKPQILRLGMNCIAAMSERELIIDQTTKILANFIESRGLRADFNALEPAGTDASRAQLFVDHAFCGNISPIRYLTPNYRVPDPLVIAHKKMGDNPGERLLGLHDSMLASGI